MKIKRLELKGFGKFNNFNTEFDEGFNIVYGVNESGKSTIQLFIKAMFYSLKGGRNYREGLINPKKRYKPWSDSTYKGSLKYILDNGQCFTVERNFDSGEARVYDSLYMDITKTFDQSKDKGPLFAIKHIGLTEDCFEKTCFIGQMSTRFNTGESKEVIERLSNISETGFEDVSFKVACDAIKEALRNYVGTEKTSIRPLDVINSKLSELNIKKQSLIKGREVLFSIESEMTGLTSMKNSLIEEKSVLTFSKEIIKLREDLEVFKRNKKDLYEITSEISQLKNESSSIADSIDDYRKTKKQLDIFSQFGFEDAGQLLVQYTKFESMNTQNGKLLTEIQQLKQKANEIEVLLGKLKEFNAYTDVIDMPNTIADNQFNLESINNTKFQRKLNLSGKKNFSFTVAMAVIFVLMTGTLIYGITKEKTIVSIIGVGFFIILFFLLVIFKMLDVKSTNEFFEKKALYDSKSYELGIINKQIAELEAAFETNRKSVLELYGKMKEILLVSSIIGSPELEIKREHIEKFQHELSRYKELTAFLSNREELIIDIDKRINGLYNKVQVLYGQKVDNEAELAKIIYELDNKIKNLYEGIDVYAYKIKSVYEFSSLENISYDKLMEIIMDLGTYAAREQIDELMQKVSDRMNEVQLLIKEKEMMLKELTDDSYELEQLEENIRELNLNKGELEDTRFSLRTALEVLEEANAEIKRDFAPLLNSNTSQIISKITASRYGKLKADEQLVLRTTEPTSRDIVPVSILSGGTIDQMYLALRIALVQTIERKDEKLPLIMDEVLAQYDDTRSLETIKMLKELSKERQIILFTCKKREVELVKYVCNNNLNIIELL